MKNEGSRDHEMSKEGQGGGVIIRQEQGSGRKTGKGKSVREGGPFFWKEMGSLDEVEAAWADEDGVSLQKGRRARPRQYSALETAQT